MTALALVLALLPLPTDHQVLYDRLTAQVAAGFDSARGGFVSKDRPHESAVALAFVLAGDGDAGPWKPQALATVNWTRSLLDTVGGGFLQRSADADPMQPSFEKRTDANSRRLENLIDAWRATGDERYRRDAVRVIDFFERVLLDGRGGFVAGQVGDRQLVPEANGHAIHAYLRWAAATGDVRSRDFALKSLDRVWENCWSGPFGLLRRGTFGEIIEQPQLLDQVEMGRALALAAHLVGRPEDLARARLLGDLVTERFQNHERGGFMTQAAVRKDGRVKRSARVDDENARAARFLCELSTATKQPKYREAAVKAWQGFDKSFEKAGLSAADWALAVRAATISDLPARPQWVQVVAKPAPRKKSNRYFTGRR